MQFLGPAILEYTVNGNVLNRRGNASTDFAPHGVFPAEGEDRWVAIAVTSDDEWSGLCRVISPLAADDRFATMEARLANQDALEKLIADWTRTRDVADIENSLQAERVPVHRLTTTADVFSDPQLAAREHIVTVNHGELGDVPVENSRMRFSATPANVTTSGPTFGQHNQQVLTEILGLDDEAFVELLAEGVLA
jgi:benzylsuccinate CoA-transferase BbsF subunit